MEVKYLGHASFLVEGKSVKVLFDPFDPSMVGLPFSPTKADIVAVSHSHGDHNCLKNVTGDYYLVAGPGEYETRGVKINGIPSFHDEQGGQKRGRNTIYLAEIDGVFFCHLGDLGHALTDDQLKFLGAVDVLFVPVGGFYTIDAQTAVSVISQIEPKIVIPMHFRAAKMKSAFDSLTTLEDFIKESGETPRTEKTLRITREGLGAEETVLVVLANSMV